MKDGPDGGYGKDMRDKLGAMYNFDSECFED
jgi:hypothetical protein